MGGEALQYDTDALLVVPFDDQVDPVVRSGPLVAAAEVFGAEGMGVLEDDLTCDGLAGGLSYVREGVGGEEPGMVRRST